MSWYLAVRFSFSVVALASLAFVLSFFPFSFFSYSSFTDYNSANCASSYIYGAYTGEVVGVPVIIYELLLPHGVFVCVE